MTADISWVPAPDNEYWRDVYGFESLYIMNAEGTVWSLDRLVEGTRPNGQPYRQYWRGKLRQPFTTRRGHQQLILFDAEHRPRTRSVQRLLRETWGNAA